MPVFNGGDYLALAVESVIDQTYKNFEIILVNDGSTDGGHTDSVCRGFEARFPGTVKYVSKENGGVASALNAALAAMQGDIFCWLSHDDLFEPIKLERQVAFFRDLDRADAILFSDYQLIDPGGQPTHAVKFDHGQFTRAPQLPLFRGAINGCTIFVPIHLMREAGGFDERYRFTQDYWLWLKLWRRYEFFHQPELLVRYRQHPGQDSHKPAAVAEGEDLWRAMVDTLSVADHANMYGSTWRFWNETYQILNPSPYSEVAAYCLGMREGCEARTLVSVIIPLHNEMGLALRALRSVQAQTHQQVEIILIDDGSTEDASVLIAACEADPRCRFIRQDNRGPAAARNHGLRVSRGDYVAFLDADDQYRADKIEIQLREMSRSGSLASHTSYISHFAPTGEDTTAHSGRESGNLYPAIISSCVIATPTVMLHRVVLARGFQFPEDLEICEDVLAWCWLARRTDILGLDQPLTIVERDGSSAALNAEKSRRGLSGLLEGLLRDPVHAREHEALERLRGALDTFGGPIEPAARRSDDHLRLIAEAEKVHLEGRHAEAALLIEQALTIQASSHALYFSGLLHYVLGDFDTAIMRLGEAAAAAESVALAQACWLQMGLGFSRKGNLDKAAHYLGRHVASPGASDVSRYHYASVLAHQRDFIQAERLFATPLRVPLGNGLEGSTAIVRFDIPRGLSDRFERHWIDPSPAHASVADYCLFVALDQAYLERYGPALLSSIRRNGSDTVHLHVHVINPTSADPLLTLKAQPSDRVSVSAETVCLDSLSLEAKRTYYSCARYRAANRFARGIADQIIVADADQMLVAPPDERLRLQPHELARLMYYPDSTSNIFSSISASVSVFATSDAGMALLGEIADYVETVLSGDIANPWHLDQVALAVSFLKDRSGAIGSLSPEIMSGSQHSVDWQVQKAIFATITSSVPGADERAAAGDLAVYFDKAVAPK